VEERKWSGAYPSWIVEPQNKRKKNKKKGGAQIQSRPFNPYRTNVENRVSS